MSLAVHEVTVDQGIAIVRTEARADLSGLNDLMARWRGFQADDGVAAVAVVSVDRNFSTSEPTRRTAPRLIGPKAAGLLKPFGVGLRGDVLDFGLQLVADADVVLVTADVLLADTGADRGAVAGHASLLLSHASIGEVNRLALLGRRGAITAERALQLGIADAVVEADDLEAALAVRLRLLCAN